MEKRQKTIGWPMTGRMESVQVLRGIAALFVVCQHICFLQRGSFGVDLFFVISGFVMMLATQKSTEHFMAKRALRILPLYYAATLFSFLILLVKPELFENTRADAGGLIRSLLFIPFSQDGVTQPLFRVGWTVNYEVEFYVLFWLAMKISMRFRALLCAGMLGILTLLGIMFPGLPEPFAFWCDSIVLEFAFGMGLFYAVRALPEGRRGKTAQAERDVRRRKKAVCASDGGEERADAMRAQAAGCAAMILAGAAVFFYEWKSYELPAVCALPQAVRWGLPSALLFFIFAAAGRSARMPRMLTMLGNMSFSVYLIHYYPMQFLNRILRRTTAPDGGQVLLTLAVSAAVLALSLLSYYLVERKLTEFLKRKLLLRGRHMSAEE